MRKLGRSGVDVSEVSLGTWGLTAQSYGPVEQERVRATISAALANGISTLDVAPNWGASETIVGELVQPRRNDVQLISRTGRTEAASIKAECEHSMMRLRTDRIDVYLINHPTAAQLTSDAVPTAMLALKSSGKIRAWGVSTSDAVTARRALEIGVDALMLPHNLLMSDLLMNLASDLAVQPTAILVRSVLAYGLLANTFQRGHLFQAGDHRQRRWTTDGLNERLRHVEALKFLVHDNTTSMADAAIKFALSDEIVSSCVIGARSPAQAKSAASLMTGPPYLDDGDLIRIPQMLASMGV